MDIVDQPHIAGMAASAVPGVNETAIFVAVGSMRKKMERKRRKTMLDYRGLIKSLRAKESRDNRALLDQAADAIETLFNGIKAYQMAAQRNEPMKPIKTEDPFQWHCPRCGSLIGVDGQDEENDYCCDCGQRLDWVADHGKNGG